MPIYEFVCRECDEKFEKLIFSSSPAPRCPHCDCADVKKVPSVFGFSSSGRTVTSSAKSGCATCRSHNCAECG